MKTAGTAWLMPPEPFCFGYRTPLMITGTAAIASSFWLESRPPYHARVTGHPVGVVGGSTDCGAACGASVIGAAGAAVGATSAAMVLSLVFAFLELPK